MNNLTLRELAVSRGITVNGAVKNWQRAEVQLSAAGLRTYSQAGASRDAVPSDEELAIFWPVEPRRGAKAPRKVKAPRAAQLTLPAAPVSVAEPVTSKPETLPGSEVLNEKGVEWSTLGINVGSIGLKAFGLVHFFSWAGVFAGLIFSLVGVASLFSVRNNKRGNTSQHALKTALWLEVGLSPFDCVTIRSFLPAVDPELVGRIAKFAPMFSTEDYVQGLFWAASAGLAALVAGMSYRSLFIAREHFAEALPENENELDSTK